MDTENNNSQKSGTDGVSYQRIMPERTQHHFPSAIMSQKQILFTLLTKNATQANGVEEEISHTSKQNFAYAVHFTLKPPLKKH